MTDQIYEQLILFAVSIYTGAIMAFVYDLIRIHRIVRKTKMGFVWAQDIIYWICFSCVTYNMFLEYNYGGIRGYGIVGVMLGMAAYLGTISRFFVKYASKIIIKIQKILVKPLKILCKPFKLGYKLLRHKVDEAIIWLRKIIQIREKQEIQPPED